MSRFRAMIVSIVTIGVLVVSAQAALACSGNTWYGPGGNASAATSGSWETAGYWSADAVPSGADAVCITVPGTYTVTLAPQNGASLGDAVASLTLGATSGSQTLDVSGQGAGYNGDQYNQTTLTVSGAATINADGTVALDATNQTASGTSSSNAGGGNAALHANVVNYGHIVTQSEDPSWGAILWGGLTNEPGANVSVNSGTFTESQASPYNWTSTNDGTITVASGASFALSPSGGGTAEFSNDGSVVNNGSIADNVNGTSDIGGSSIWTQSGGSVLGNAVALQDGTTLADSAGTGAFVVNNDTATITGTIPAGQTVTVQGAPFNSGGEQYNSTAASLGGSTLVNDGTLVLDASGSGTSSGGSVYLNDGTIQNHGTINADVTDASRQIHLQAALDNEHGGTLSVSGGSFDQDSQTSTTNDGLVTLGPGVVYLIDEGASFTNASDGTVSPQIASASSFGSFQLASPCCAAAGAFTAGGTLAPLLTGGFAPAQGQEFQLVAISGTFTGNFATVANGFSGDYSHEGSSPEYFGAIYGSAVGGGGGTSGTGGAESTLAAAHLSSASGANGKLTLKLSCRAGGSACGSLTATARVTEHLTGGKLTAVAARGTNKRIIKRTTTRQVVVATGSATLAAGSTKILTLRLNSTGTALLKRFHKLTVRLTVTSAGSAIDTVSIGVQPAKVKPR